MLSVTNIFTNYYQYILTQQSVTKTMFTQEKFFHLKSSKSKPKGVQDTCSTQISTLFILYITLSLSSRFNQIILYYLHMPKRKAWTQEEDRILALVKQAIGRGKWVSIASTMKKKYGITGRSAKQCRERYLNHLTQGIVNSNWTQQEENILLEAHSKLGNRWTLIAKRLPGRSDNCIKNHFYSKVRKSVRKFNKAFFRQGIPGFKEITPSELTKILEVSEEQFKPVSSFSSSVIEISTSIKNQLLNFLNQEPTCTIQVKSQCRFQRLLEDYQKFQQLLGQKQSNQKTTKVSQVNQHLEDDVQIKMEEERSSYKKPSSIQKQLKVSSAGE